jgi:antitoxin (DNA-binding transcriptional repressor) of toxin-antitoxin stability system
MPEDGKTVGSVTLAEAMSRLPSLVEKARAGTDVVIVEGGIPLARLVAPEHNTRQRGVGRPGAMKSRLWIADDFDELPEDMARALGARD